MKRLLAIFALWLLTVAGACATGLQLVGEGRLKVLFWSVYDSRLYTADGTYLEDQRPVRLDIEYLMNVDSSDLVARTRQEWQFQNLRHPGQRQWLERLGAMWPDVREGDVLSLQVDQQEHSSFLLNGELLGRIEDEAFTRQFLAIWLAPETSQPELRLALTGRR
jgi:hypothetical protein